MTFPETKDTYPGLSRLIESLQAAYNLKDPAKAREFVHTSFVGDGAVLIIGTESGEWFEGTEDITKLFYWDWETWGDVDFGFDSRCWIRCNGTSAQIASEGTCGMVLDREKTAGEYISGTVQSILSSKASESGKILELIRTGMHVYSQLQYGDSYTWPIRFTAFAEEIEEAWRFSQMHFSIPSLSIPAVRNGIPSYTDGEDHPFFRDIPC